MSDAGNRHEGDCHDLSSDLDQLAGFKVLPELSDKVIKRSQQSLVQQRYNRVVGQNLDSVFRRGPAQRRNLKLGMVRLGIAGDLDTVPYTFLCRGNYGVQRLEIVGKDVDRSGKDPASAKLSVKDSAVVFR